MPYRLADVARVMHAHGIELETSRGKGSHVVFRGDSGSYPVPAHNGLKTELTNVYLRGLCRKFDLDEDDVKSEL